jgi:hypothetical protein
MRPTHGRHWRVPLDRAGELSRAVIVEDGRDKEPPTRPGTPKARKGER